jgi:hypothetical protein
MDSDFSVRNELDSVVRGPTPDSDKYKVENPFSKLVDAFGTQQNTSESKSTPNDNSWKAQAFFASSVAQQQADIAHRTIDLMHRHLFQGTEPPTTNYWKYVAIASLGLLGIVIVVYWKSKVNLRFVPEKFDNLTS